MGVCMSSKGKNKEKERLEAMDNDKIMMNKQFDIELDDVTSPTERMVHQLPPKSVNCCKPNCCSKTNKPMAATQTTPDEDDFLLRAFLRRSGEWPEIEKAEPMSRFLSSRNKLIPIEPFPATGPLGLAEKHRTKIGDFWDNLEKKEDFVGAYLALVFANKNARRPFFVPREIPDGKTMEELRIYKRHIFLQTLSFDALIGEINSDKNIKRLAQELGLRHLKFSHAVVFEDWMWNHIIKCFMDTLKASKAGEDVLNAWRRLLIWFFTHFHNSYHNQNKQSSTVPPKI